MSLWPPGWRFCQPVPPFSSSLSWPCSRLPQVISVAHKGTHALTRISGTKTKVKCTVFPLSHGRSSAHLVSRQDPGACRKAERGVLLSSELPRSRACARRGPAARGWKQSCPRECVLLRGWEKGFRWSGKGFVGDPGALPSSLAAAGSGTTVYHHMSKIGGVSPHIFTSLIFHKDQLL